ncbi:peptidase [Paenibacillus sp. 2TAB26]|uniref:peptidase n=1 Tax=Paenibacillus sp. 2TAB26 TaxID=3233005 RepID=UPI003F943510
MKWKNLTAKVTGVCALSILLISTTVFAGGAASTESSKTKSTVNGYTYNAYSTAEVSLWTWNTYQAQSTLIVQVDGGGNAPSGYMGGQARLYNFTTAVLKVASPVKYTTSATSLLVTNTAQQATVTDEATYYGQGKVQYYNGNGYVGIELTKSPNVILSNSSNKFSGTNQLPDNLKDQEEYAVNNNGETYGSGLLESKIGEEPDLILAEGTNGVQGYVKADDLFPIASSLQEATISNSNGDIQVISLYDQDGLTVIGEFELKEGNSVTN